MWLIKNESLSAVLYFDMSSFLIKIKKIFSALFLIDKVSFDNVNKTRSAVFILYKIGLMVNLIKILQLRQGMKLYYIRPSIIWENLPQSVVWRKSIEVLEKKIEEKTWWILNHTWMHYIDFFILLFICYWCCSVFEWLLATKRTSILIQSLTVLIKIPHL